MVSLQPPKSSWIGQVDAVLETSGFGPTVAYVGLIDIQDNAMQEMRGGCLSFDDSCGGS